MEVNRKEVACVINRVLSDHFYKGLHQKAGFRLDDVIKCTVGFFGKMTKILHYFDELSAFGACGL